MLARILFSLILRLILSIVSFYFLYKVYINTSVDPLQIPFNFEEKKQLFRDSFQNTNEFHDKDFKCKTYEELIMEPKTQKLGDVFELNFNKLFNCSFFLIAFLIYDIFSISFLFLTIIIIKINEVLNNIYQTFVSVIITFITIFRGLLIIYLVNFIFFIYAIYSFYSGDINTYCDFLICRNVNYVEFEKYRSVEIVRFYFKNYIISYVILSIVISTFGQALGERNV